MHLKDFHWPESDHFYFNLPWQGGSETQNVIEPPFVVLPLLDTNTHLALVLWERHPKWTVLASERPLKSEFKVSPVSCFTNA